VGDFESIGWGHFGASAQNTTYTFRGARADYLNLESSMLGRIFLSRYQATRLLGEGGMGRVYLARQLDLGRQVVVKVMHDHVASDKTFHERFQRETLLMARFQHPYAVTLFDASLNDPEGPCIVMEYIKGVTLDVLLQRNGRLSAPRLARLLGQLCEVLQAAHEAGIIHRDLKPGNLMVVDPDTPYEKIKVMDFGLATLINPKTLKKITDTNTDLAVGTPGYMCPEQVRGDDVDHRGDLYSVGVILFEMLTGKPPFAGRSSMAVMIAHATEDPPSFAHTDARVCVPPAIEAVVMSCLAKDPAQRPASARKLAELYELALEQPADPQSTTAPAPSPETDARTCTVNVTAAKPNEVVHHLQAWMPETIAACKLRGFVHDVGGEVQESIPGRIRVVIGSANGLHGSSRTGPLSWLGIGRKSAKVEMELQLERSSDDRQNLLQITVIMRPTKGYEPNAAWRDRCTQLFCDLRAYLMGTGAVAGSLC
jgi:serine/threonine-protein kinase